MQNLSKVQNQNRFETCRASKQALNPPSNLALTLLGKSLGLLYKAFHVPRVFHNSPKNNWMNTNLKEVNLNVNKRLAFML
jgi:hypothetical protein